MSRLSLLCALICALAAHAFSPARPCALSLRARRGAATPSKVLVLPETAAALDPSSDLFKSAVEGFLYTFTLSWPLGLPMYALFKLRALPEPVLDWMDGYFGAGAQRGVSAQRAAEKKER